MHIEYDSLWYISGLDDGLVYGIRVFGGHTISGSWAHHVFAIVRTRHNGTSERYHILELANESGTIHIRHAMRETLEEAKDCRLNMADCARWQGENDVDPPRPWSAVQQVINGFERGNYDLAIRNCRHFVEALQTALGIAKEW
jgi:hypothetical protein